MRNELLCSISQTCQLNMYWNSLNASTATSRGRVMILYVAFSVVTQGDFTRMKMWGFQEKQIWSYHIVAISYIKIKKDVRAHSILSNCTKKFVDKNRRRANTTMADILPGALEPDLDMSWLEIYLGISKNNTDRMDQEAMIMDLYTAYTVPIHGYLTPALCFVVLLSNILFLIVFAVRKMNSPTHVILKAIAVSDTLTILLPTPCFVYMYFLGNYTEYVPYDLCLVWDSFVTLLPTITHTASTWLTCLLAIQRYICVSFPLNVRLWCGMKRTYIFVVTIFILATGCHIGRFFETEIVKVTTASKTDPSQTMEGCHRKPNSDFVSLEYQIAYYWVRAVFVNILPCIVMVTFSSIMLVKIRRAEKSRRTFLRRRSTFGSGENEPRESLLTTWLVIFIMNSVIIVEMPIAVYFILYTTSVTTGQVIIPLDLVLPVEIILNLVVQASYPLLFVMYCFMSDNFRKTLKNILSIPCAWCWNNKCDGLTCCASRDTTDSLSVTTSHSRRSTGVMTVSESGINIFTTV